MNVSTLMTERPICLGRPNYCQFTTAHLFSFGVALWPPVYERVDTGDCMDTSEISFR